MKQQQFADLNNRLIRNFWRIHHTMRRISEGKASQRRILMLLLETETRTQRELTQLLGIQSGSASEVLGKLEAAGLITRTPSAADRRTTDLSLTEAGRAEAFQALAQRKERHEQMFSCLSTEEREALLVLLEKLNHSWEDCYRHAKRDLPKKQEETE